MEEVATVRRMIDLAIQRLEAGPHDHPLLGLDRVRLRRLLAEAAYREIRSLRREIAAESGEQPPGPTSS
ncbi:MAG TPA: hypothetical protein VF013_03725 [Candidatus Limnocylindria bacterium]